MLRLRELLVEWVSTLEPDSKKIWRACRSLPTAIGTALAVAALLVLIAWVPPPHGLFGLILWPVLGLDLLAIASTWTMTQLDARRPLAPPARALGLLAVASVMQLFASSLVVFSEVPGSYVLASAPMVALWLHGLLLRPTLHAPYPVGAHAIGMLAAFALRPAPDPAVILLLAFTVGAAGSLAIGTLAAGGARRAATLAVHREAIEAQALEQRRLAATVADLEECSREAGALVGAGLRELHALADAPETWRDAAARSEASALARALRAALERIQHGLIASDAQEGAPEFEAVDVTRVAREVVADTARHFPHVALTGPLACADGRRALLNGGEESLRLILEILLENACEGDGVRAALAVEVSIAAPPADPSDLAVVVRDDGPGFRPEILASPVRAFSTTKAEGTGLGLYTATRLAAASGGGLRLENVAGAGAVVTLRLRAAPAPARDAA